MTKLRRSIAVLACVLGTAAMLASGTTTAAETTVHVRDTLTAAQLRTVALRLVEAGVPAVVIRVDDGRTALTAALGYADLGARRPAQVTDTFRVGSITKQFVATVVLQLVGEKRLRLSDRVGRWVPNLPAAWRAVTLNELLRQQTGISNYTPAWASELLNGTRPASFRYSPRALLDLVATAPLQDAPGTRFSDSNTNFVLLGLVVEQATHMSLGAVLTQRIIRPLGLRDTSYELGTLHGNHLHGYEDFSTAMGVPGPDRLIDMQPVNGTGYDASGALTSTVGDLSRYLRALLGGRLLRPAQLRAMQTLMRAPFAPGPDPPPFSPSYWGLGLEGTTTSCGRIYGGTGGVLGYGAIMAGTPGGHRIVTLGVNELQSLPGLVAVLQREILPLMCRPRGKPSLVAASSRSLAFATFTTRPSRSGTAGGQAGRLALRLSVLNRTNGRGGEYETDPGGNYGDSFGWAGVGRVAACVCGGGPRRGGDGSGGISPSAAATRPANSRLSWAAVQHGRVRGIRHSQPQRGRRAHDHLRSPSPRPVLATWFMAPNYDRLDHAGIVSLVARSDDAGRRWRLLRTPGLSPCAGGRASLNADPAVAWGSDGWSYFLFDQGKIVRGAPVTQLGVYRFAPSGTVAGKAVPLTTAPGYNDRPTITTDPRDPARMYVIWVVHASGESSDLAAHQDVVMLAVSTDHGQRWSRRAIYKTTESGLWATQCLRSAAAVWLSPTAASGLMAGRLMRCAPATWERTGEPRSASES